MHLFKQQIVRYTIDGKRRTPDGQAVTSKTPGAVRHVTESAKWYAVIGGRHVPLAESKETAKRLYRIKTGDQAVAEVLPYAERQQLAMKDEIERPLREHLADFRKRLEAENNCPDHISRTVARIGAILDGCGFRCWEDLSAEAVLSWLARQRNETQQKDRYGFGLATTNHYITAIKGFSRWLAGGRNGHGNGDKPRVPADPLFGLKKLSAESDVRIERRELSEADFQAFLKAAKSGPICRDLTGAERHVLYVVAAYTGLRAGELATLLPGSFQLDADPPTVKVKGAYTKNKKPAELPLHSSVIGLLREFIRSKDPKAPLWPGKADAPCERWHKHAAAMVAADLEAAGLPYLDDAGRVFDFHALRHQFITALGRAGVALQMAQALARHSTPVLTANTYTHLRLNDQAAAAGQLPKLAAVDLGEEEVPARRRRTEPGAVTRGLPESSPL